MRLYNLFENTQPIEEGPNDPHIFKAIFLAGGPGSGKSFVSSKLLGGTGLRVVNSDDIYEYLMNKQNLALDPETIFSPQGQEIRGKAKELTKKRRSHYLDGRIGIVVDGTGKDVDKVEAEAKKLRELGYDTMMLFVNTSLDVAQERNQMRSRKLDPKEVEKIVYETVEKIIEKPVIKTVEKIVYVDNSIALKPYDQGRRQMFDM